MTWKIHKRSELQLRGCIGCLVPIPLSEMEHYAEERSDRGDGVRRSAFGDYRFHPISAGEIPSLQCSVSLLHSFEDGRDYRDWEVKRSSFYFP